MDRIGMTWHLPFGMAALGLLVLNLAGPFWWPAGIGWIALAVLITAWTVYGIRNPANGPNDQPPRSSRR